MNGFYIKHNIRLKWVNPFRGNLPIMLSSILFHELMHTGNKWETNGKMGTKWVDRYQDL